VPEHDRAKSEQAHSPSGRGAAAAAPTPHGALALQRSIGNRATTRLLSRMEPSEASEQIQKSLAPLTDAATVGRTLLPFTYDVEGFDKVAEDYEKTVERPMMADLPQSAQDMAPAGWYPGVSKAG